jgi:DNA-binding NarL/FixJ family response regulator
MEAGALGYVIKHSAAEELILAVRAAAAAITPAIAENFTSPCAPAARISSQTDRRHRSCACWWTGTQLRPSPRLDISPRTVEFHKYTMMQTLGVTSTAELIRFALQSGASEI